MRVRGKHEMCPVHLGSFLAGRAVTEPVSSRRNKAAGVEAGKAHMGTVCTKDERDEFGGHGQDGGPKGRVKTEGPGGEAETGPTGVWVSWELHSGAGLRLAVPNCGGSPGISHPARVLFLV